jgi:hypothetical protein
MPGPKAKVPTFRYPGGKAQLAKRIAALLAPAYCYVEPFAGRANLYFRVAAHGMYKHYWLNDRYLRFVHSVMAYGPWMPISGKEDFAKWQKYAEQDGHWRRRRDPDYRVDENHSFYCSRNFASDKIFASPAFLLQPILSFSGGTYAQGSAGNGDPARTGRKGFAGRIRLAAEIIRRTKPNLTCKHFMDVLEECDEFEHEMDADFVEELRQLNEEAGFEFRPLPPVSHMVYIDPPYRLANVGASYKPLPRHEYEKMIEFLLNAKFKWALSEYDDPIYRPLAEKFGEPKRFNVRKQMLSHGERPEAVECLWRNYALDGE